MNQPAFPGSMEPGAAIELDLDRSYEKYRICAGAKKSIAQPGRRQMPADAQHVPALRDSIRTGRNDPSTLPTARECRLISRSFASDRTGKPAKTSA